MHVLPLYFSCDDVIFCNQRTISVPCFSISLFAWFTSSLCLARSSAAHVTISERTVADLAMGPF